MSKKSNWQFEDWLLLFGGAWFISQLFNTAEEAGIGALPKANRKIIPYTKGKANIFTDELARLHRDESGQIIRLMIVARLAPRLQMPLYKKFDNKFISSEIRDLTHGWRVFLYKISDTDYIAVSFFKKKTNKTPLYEIEKAEKRIKELLGSNG